MTLALNPEVEEFSNLVDLQWIPVSGDKVDGSFHELDRMLPREKLLQ